VRASATCEKNVYNNSSLTREEAEALILAKEGRLCVRYFQRKDGTILLKDCSVGIVQKRKRRVLAAGVAALLGGAVVAGFISRPKKMSCAGANVAVQPSHEAQAISLTNVMSAEPAPPTPPEEHHVIMGDVISEPVHDIRGKIAIDRDVLGVLE
jgi:hypothetical protein